MKRALVTGAGGFIGSALCRRLCELGTEVIAVVREQSTDLTELETLPGVKVIRCDMSDYDRLPQLAGGETADVFFHLAWAGSAGALRGDAEVQTDNIRYSCEAVRACSALGCKRFVYASSIMEYEYRAAAAKGIPQGINSIYSIAKATAGDMAEVLAGSLGTEYCRALISNVYGPGEKSRRLIISSLRSLLEGKECAFSAGEQLYDFIYISDAVNAFIAAAEKGVPGKTYYIGSPSPRPLKDFLLRLGSLTGRPENIGLGKYPFNGVSLSYKEFDLSALSRDTGFMPEVSFDEGIERTIQWIRRNTNERI